MKEQLPLACAEPTDWRLRAMEKEKRAKAIIELMELISNAEVRQLKRATTLNARGMISDHEYAKCLGEIAEHYDAMRSLVN